MSNTILCVDDSLTMQTVAEITFRNSDFEYQGALTAEEALKAAKTKEPAIILVDAVMPDTSGYDLAKELKGSTGAIVVMMCGNSEAYDESKGAAAGCDGHVTKPWQTDKLIDELSALAKAGPKVAAPPAAGVVTAPAPPASAPSATNGAPMAAAAKAAEPPRNATLMGMPALDMQMPEGKPLPAGVAAVKPQGGQVSPEPTVAAKGTSPGPAAPAGISREPMIKSQPGKPIRLVLASQAEEMAKKTAESGGLSSQQASALNDVTRELLEQIIWEVVPDLAEAIIKENLQTLTAKAR